MNSEIEYKTVLVFGDESDRVIETVGELPDGQSFEVGYYNGDDKAKAIVNISPATGCAVGCNFCELTDVGSPLSTDLMVQQVRDMVEYAQQVDGYYPAYKPLKVHFAKTGEPTFNRQIPEAMRRIVEEFPGTSFKYSTSLPDIKPLQARIKEIAEFAHGYKDGTVQLQLSLISTNEAFRQQSVGTRGKMGLVKLPQVRDVVNAWHAANPFGRTPNCSLLVSSATPCDPAEIADILPPGTVRFRIRKVVETQHGNFYNLKAIDDEGIGAIMAKFKTQHYHISDAGIPTPTEATHALAANVTRERVKEGQYPAGVWHVGASGRDFESMGHVALRRDRQGYGGYDRPEQPGMSLG